MCGIAAIFSRQAPIAPATIERATRSLYHRGPDGQRHWISADGRVALGHARLSIIDLATGDQPIASEDEGTRIVNGEFYDFEAIQHELERGGHRLRTRSDSEIALHLYEDIGPAVRASPARRVRVRAVGRAQPHDVRGPRSVRHQAAVLRWHDGALYLASEVKALFAAGVPARWDTECAVHDSSNTADLQTSTLFDGVRQVPPGHYLLADRSAHPARISYWDFDYPRGDDVRQRPADEYVEEFRACARGGGPSAVARRRAGRLLSERRPRFVRRARPGRPASSAIRSAHSR